VYWSGKKDSQRPEFHLIERSNGRVTVERAEIAKFFFFFFFFVAKKYYVPPLILSI
jgi:hypothetical protein